MSEHVAPPRLALGYAAMAVAVIIWAGWIVLVRGTVTGLMSPLDIAVLRYGAPAILLSPVLLRIGLAPRGVSIPRLAAMTLGWGAPFALLAAEGARSGGTSLFAALVPGALPLWVAVISVAVFGARYAKRPLIGLALIAAAAVAALAPAVLGDDSAALRGAPWFCAASIAWATYAVAYRGSGLAPIEATALVAFWSCALLAPLILWRGIGLLDLPVPVLLGQVALHGVVSGVVSVATFAIALRELGAARAATCSALVPVIAALGGVFLLGEAAEPHLVAAIALASLGVALVNAPPGAFRLR